MILSKDDMATLNHFATDAGGDSLIKLAKIAYEYYAKQAVLSTTGNETLVGAARFAMWLETLPKALRERQN